MALLDASMPGVATTLIRLFGVAATLTKVAGGTYDPATDTTTGGSSTDIAVKCSPPQDGNRGRKAPSGFVTTPQIITYMNNATVPAVGDTLLLLGRRYQVACVNALYSGELVAAYVVTLS